MNYTVPEPQSNQENEVWKTEIYIDQKQVEGSTR